MDALTGRTGAQSAPSTETKLPMKRSVSWFGSKACNTLQARGHSDWYTKVEVLHHVHHCLFEGWVESGLASGAHQNGLQT